MRIIIKYRAIKHHSQAESFPDEDPLIHMVIFYIPECSRVVSKSEGGQVRLSKISPVVKIVYKLLLYVVYKAKD